MDVNRGVDTVVTGADVYGRDGEKLGIVSDVSEDYMVVESGLFSTKTLRIPCSTVSKVLHGSVHLSISASEADAMGGWLA